MSRGSATPIIEAIRPEYLAARKKGKGTILSNLEKSTGLQRKYLIHLLRHPEEPALPCKPGPKKGAPGRIVFTGEVVEELQYIWEICGRICSKRLQPFLPEIVQVLERCGERQFTPRTKMLLNQISCATLDKCLSPARAGKAPSIPAPRPGTLCRQVNPVLTFSPWESNHPGFLDISFAAHCGSGLCTGCLFSLSVVDEATGWRSLIAIPNALPSTVYLALGKIRNHLPFPMLGLKSDEIDQDLNGNMIQWCREEGISFACTRKARMDRYVLVEHKSWSIIEQVIGEARLTSPEQLTLLNSVYGYLAHYCNFFQPILKLIRKERARGRMVRQHDTAATPYQRVINNDSISQAVKNGLRVIYPYLNPVKLTAYLAQEVQHLKATTFVLKNYPSSFLSSAVGSYAQPIIVSAKQD